jgi:transcription termination factor NusB
VSPGGREAALEALTACRRLDAWSDSSLKTACRVLDRREAALAARLAYGVLQNRALLDFYLDACCIQRFAELEPFIRDVLRLGAYQVLYMDRVPDSAAVDESVALVKRKKRQRAAGLVNAVLRRLRRESSRRCRRQTGRSICPYVIATRPGWSVDCWSCWGRKRRRHIFVWITRRFPPLYS